jgi:predicted transcriptional regulator
METYFDMLAAIGKGAEKPTHIMYKANLSWNVMQSYLKVLVTQGLVVITPEDEKKTYHLTPKGLQVLNHFESVMTDLKLAKQE